MRRAVRLGTAVTHPQALVRPVPRQAVAPASQQSPRIDRRDPFSPSVALRPPLAPPHVQVVASLRRHILISGLRLTLKGMLGRRL